MGGPGGGGSKVTHDFCLGKMKSLETTTEKKYIHIYFTRIINNTILLNNNNLLNVRGLKNASMKTYKEMYKLSVMTHGCI